MSDIFSPVDEAEVAASVMQAGKTGKTLEIVGGGTKLGVGHDVHASARLSTAALSEITLYEPGALTMVAKAGTPLSTINAALKSENQNLPFEPATYSGLFGSNGEPTIGGVVACGISGPRRIQAGACRDSLIGVRFVNGAGEIIKNGGRVMKNVTGYDLVKLMCGAYGTLGILTEVAFKLLPAPQTTATVVLNDVDFETATRAMSAALGSPYDVSGAAFQPASSATQSQALIRIEGFEKSVAHRAKELRELLSTFGDAQIIDEPAIAEGKWVSIREADRHHDQDGALWRISLKPTDGPELVSTIAKSGEFDFSADWGGGLIWLRADASQLQTWGSDVQTGMSALHALLQSHVGKTGGHVTLMRAHKRDAIDHIFQPEPDAVAKITKGLKSQFDPANILNPGRMRV